MKTILLMTALVALSCMKIEVRAPKGSTVQLSEQELRAVEKTSRDTRKKNWFLLSGLVPLNDNSTKRIIPDECTKVSVTTHQTLGDIVVSTISPAVGVGLIAVTGARAVGRLLDGGALGANRNQVLLGLGVGLAFTIFPPVRTTTQALCLGRSSSALLVTPSAIVEEASLTPDELPDALR